MRFRFWGAVSAAGIALLAAAGARADTMVVAGHRIESPAAFVTAGDDVFAPLLPALQYLGARCELTPDAIKITTRGRREIVISRKRAEATRDGVLRALPGPPQGEGENTLLPARAVGSMAGCWVRWEEGTRTLFLHPWIQRFSLETLPDRYRVTVRAEGPITYQTMELAGPPRLVIDLLDVDLPQIPSEAGVEGSYLKGARIRQHSRAPDPEGEITRVVVELSEWRPYRIRQSEDKCRLEIELPLPEASDLPSEAPPVVLTGLGFERISPRLAAVNVTVTGTAVCTLEKSEEAHILWVNVANATSEIKIPDLEVTDPLVSGVCVIPAPDQEGAQRVAVRLRGSARYAVVSEGGAVRVLLAECALSELSVVVDAGHGGHDTGAIGRSGLREKEMNLDIARRLSRVLEGMGAKVRLTRADDNPVQPWARGNREEQQEELRARCAVANEIGADLFVSIHANARTSNPSEHRGTETYYRKADSALLAECVQEELVRALGLPDGGVTIHPKPIIVLYATEMPSVLVEVGYLTNSEDEAQLAIPEVRERAAQGIANGIKRYVEEGGLLPQLARRERERQRAAPGS